MIILKKLNGEEFVLNSELIETIMETPDTTILQMCIRDRGIPHPFIQSFLNCWSVPTILRKDPLPVSIRCW